MKPFLSLKWLFCGIAVLATVCAVLLAKNIYGRKQQELLSKATELIRQGNAFGRVVVQSLDGEPIAIRGDRVTLPIMESIVAAKRIKHVVVDGTLRPEVKSLFEDEFEPTGQHESLTMWGRK